MAKNERIKTGRLTRAAKFERGEIDESARTLSLSFSSESPIDRWFGVEILDHGQDAVDLARLMDGAPLLFNHDPDKIIGVVESASVGADRKGRAVVRFGKSALAEEKFRDAMDGVMRNSSVGYTIEKLVEEKKGTFRAARWTPLEVSLVAVPADNTVGLGRSGEQDHETIIEREEIKMTEATVPAADKIVDIAAIEKGAREAALKQARESTIEILALGTKHNRRDLADKAITEGLSIEQFRGRLLDVIGDKPLDTPLTDLGMSKREAANYSLVRAINAAASQSWKGAEFELEASRACAGKLGRTPRGFYVPLDWQKRDLTVGTASAGGNLVGTNLDAGSFIDLLRKRMMVRQMGARVLDGLVGNVAIPKLTGAATAYWVAENAATTEGAQTLGQVTLSPKTIAAYVDYSRLLTLQASPAIEGIVRDDLVSITALGIDLAALHGLGSSDQPLGIAGTSGIGSVAGGTNGAAPTWAHIVTLETEVAQDNADIESLGYLTNAKVRGKLKQTEKAANTAQFVWGDNVGEPGFGMLNGYRAGATNQVSSTLTKGSASAICSAIFFGNWADLIIGQWGVLDILVDPYTGSSAGTIRVTAFQSVDVAVRRAESFAAMLDALTA